METTRPSHLLLTPRNILLADDALLYKKWATSPNDLRHVLQDQLEFYLYGLHGVKRDVGQGLDAVHVDRLWRRWFPYSFLRKLVVLLKAEKSQRDLSFQIFTYVNPQWAILDSSLHTSRFVRTRSALSFTIVLSVGATASATLPSSDATSVVLARKLNAHAEKLHLVASATAAKSTEIIQAIFLRGSSLEPLSVLLKCSVDIDSILVVARYEMLMYDVSCTEVRITV